MLRKIVKKTIYNFQKNPLSRLLYQSEIRKRAKLPVTEIGLLSKPINIFSPTYEIHPPNDWYGHATIFKRYLGLPETYPFKFTIEHGMHLTQGMLSIEKDNNIPSVVTYSKFREKAIKPSGEETFSIGPFIYYAAHYLKKSELIKEKKRLGKTLLVFPSHSSVDFTLDYDIQRFYKNIKMIGKDFDTIRICLYWKDVLRGLGKHYEEFECVTAGHIMDPMFLPRLKSIIETSTIGMSSVVGNHVGYSVFMGKPHFVVPQKHTITGRNSEKKLIEDSWWKDPSYIEVLKAFSTFTNMVTPAQKKLINYYWGSSLIKSKKEFLDIITETEKLFKSKK